MANAVVHSPDQPVYFALIRNMKFIHYFESHGEEHRENIETCRKEEHQKVQQFLQQKAKQQ